MGDAVGSGIGAGNGDGRAWPSRCMPWPGGPLPAYYASITWRERYRRGRPL